MPGLDPMNGVGGLVPQEQTDQPQGGGSSWSDLLQNPMARSALLGFSIQALTGSWGNQLGAALGAGAESAQGTAQAMQKEGVRQAESAQAAELAREGMESHERVAEITGGSREAAAEIRGKYSLERAHISLQKASPNLANQYRESARKALGVDTNPTLMTLDSITRSKMIEDKAAEFYQNDIDRGVVPGHSGAAGPAAGSPGTSDKGPPAATGEEGGTTPPAATAPAGAKGGSATTTPPGKPPFWEAYRHPDMQKQLSTPEGQKELLRQRPDFKSNIDAYNKMMRERTETGR